MTALPASVQATLSSCAELMAQRQEAVLDLSGLRSCYENNDQANAVIAFLTTEVEHRSGSSLAIRPATIDLYAPLVGGPALYLVVCPVDVPEGPITEPADSLTYYILEPRIGGLYFARLASRYRTS